MQTLDFAGATLCLSKAGLVAGTTNKLSISATTYAINGTAYSSGAQTNATAPTTSAVTGAAFTAVGVNQGSVFFVGLNAAGALVASQGTIEALDTAGNFVTLPKTPAVPSDFCLIGRLTVKVGSTGSAWTFGSSNMSGVAGVTYTFNDQIAMPSGLV